MTTLYRRSRQYPGRREVCANAMTTSSKASARTTTDRGSVLEAGAWRHGCLSRPASAAKAQALLRADRAPLRWLARIPSRVRGRSFSTTPQPRRPPRPPRREYECGASGAAHARPHATAQFRPVNQLRCARIDLPQSSEDFSVPRCLRIGVVGPSRLAIKLCASSARSPSERLSA